MARLILLNGAPAAGKSTLARRWADAHPLALALDIDTVRGMLGSWLDDPHEAGLAARRLALAMIDAHLATGRDIIVPQYLGRMDFVLQLEQTALRAGAAFIEVLLETDAPDTIARFVARSAAPGAAPEHRDAAVLQEASGGVEALADAVARVESIAARRPRTVRVRVRPGRIDATAAALDETIERASGAA